MYSRQVDGRELTFGVSGLLYKSNVLMYDHQTESLWSQVRREAIAGPLVSTELDVLPSTLTTWRKWRRQYPETAVLSLDTGFNRDYSRDPYADYYKSRSGLFSFFKPGPGEEEKALVVGIDLDSATRAYPLDFLREQRTITDTLAGTRVELSYHPDTDRISARTADGRELAPLTLYWFVWKGMYPESELYAQDE